MSIYAALYAALVVVLGFSSYGPIQLRVADSLVAVVPLLGIAGVLGHTLGVFVGNIFSSAGPLDLLNNDYTVIATCTAYSAVLGMTVGWMLSFLYGYPLLITIFYVAIGNVIATVLIGWPLFKLLKKSGVFEKWLGNDGASYHPSKTENNEESS
jgi:uncharacterized membrane protein